MSTLKLKINKNHRVTAVMVATLMICMCFMMSCKSTITEAKSMSKDYVSIVKNETTGQVDVHIDGKYFTSYLYSDERLRKPVLFPLMTASGTRVTRGFPFDPNPGERVDHVHHYGLWFNHGVVNDVDYWNSAVIPRKPNVRYGRINHMNFKKMESGNVGILEVEKEWRDDKGALILNEVTHYEFSGDGHGRYITHSTTLTAPEVDVLFTDSKEGMFAMRVRRELEVPSEKPATLLDENLKESAEKIVDNSKVTGHYQNSEGLEGYPDVWGKRAKWMQLAGTVDQENISICIFDHPENVNHPPHWMARDYGLYGANPLGSKIYTDGKEELNFSISKLQSITFSNQVAIIDGDKPNHSKIEGLYTDFVSKN